MNLDDLSKNLGIKNNAKRVFELLLSIKPSPVSDIAKELKLPKSTVYDAISELMKISLLVEYDESGYKVYGIAPKEQIIKLHQDKIEELKISQEFISKKLNEINRNTIEQPKIKFYFGKDGMRHAFNDMPWVDGIKESYLMWPMEKMIDMVGEDFLIQHGKNRYKYKINIKAISKESDRKLRTEKESWKSGPKNFREVKYAPKNIDWAISYWVYDNKVMFSGGDGEQFAFIVYSKEFADLMKTLWQQVWKVSKK
jgi:predicted transcriptional regulator